jgi:hypothetical protein
MTAVIVPRMLRSTPSFTAWCAAKPGSSLLRKKAGSRFCEAALRKSCALHRARDTNT